MTEKVRRGGTTEDRVRMAGPRALEVAPDGSRLLVREVTGLSVVDLRGNRPPIAIRASQLHAYAVVGDQIWVAAGAPATLTTYDAGGELLARAAIPERGPSPRMLRAPSGRLASWMGTGVALISHDRGLAVTMLAADVDFALPLSPARMLVGHRHRLSLREQDVTRWTVAVAQGGWIADAALVLDGKAVAVACTQPPGAIVVVGLRDGAILHRLTVDHAADIRFAPARGVALAYTRDGRLLLIDLRFGRVIVDHREPRAISQVGIDDAAGEITLRLADRPDEIVRIAVADLMTASQPAPSRAPVRIATEPTVPTASPSPNGNGHAEPAPLVVAAAPATADPFSAGGLALACEALPPWRAVERTTSTQTTMLHARQRELSIGIVGVAIARAWDEGRLAYAQTAGLPFRSEVSGLTAGQRGLATEDLEAARRRLADAAKAALAGRRAVAPRLGPVDALGVELGLSPVARDLLLLIAAPSLWGETARLFGILSHGQDRPLVDEHLLAELLVDQAAPAQIARELDDDAPLIRHGIVRVQPGKMRPFLPLLVDPVVLLLLRGAALEPALDPPIRVVSADRTFDELRIPARTKRQIAADLAHAARPLRIAIRGRVGSGRHPLLAALAENSGRRLGVIDAAAIVRDARVRIGELAVALERSQLAGLLPCVDGLEQIASHDAATRDQVREVLRRHAGPLAVRLPWEAHPLLEPGHVLIDLPALSLTDRLTCWERTLAHHGLRVGDLGELADRYAVGPGVIERVAAELARTTAAAGNDLVPRLEAGIRQHLERRLGASATRVTRLASWSQVILPADIQDGLTELIARIKHRRLVFDTWGFHRVTSASRGVTALFQGGPGTGKTLVAGAIANELGMDLYRVDLSHVMSKRLGETEQNLARLFDAAEDGNTIILFEEIDALFARRTAEVETLSQRLDTFEGIAILTTSSGASIDGAFKRRLSLRLTFPFPGEDIREKLWRAHFPAAVPTAGAFDLAELARRYQLSGGYIRNAALRAAFLAAEEHAPLTQDHLERAIKAELRELGQDADGRRSE